MVLTLPYLVQVCYEKNWQDIPNIKETAQQVGQTISGYLLIDHSSFAQKLPANLPITYMHRPENAGLAQAYNIALERMGDAQWLILLDHDTAITSDYLQEVAQQSQHVPQDCVALCPQVFEEKRQISPIQANQYINRHFQALTTGLYQQRVMAINSATVLRKSFLLQLGGFNTQFPLDFLDHWLFFEIFQQQKSVYVLKSKLQHELSVMHYESMTTKRYQSILQAEKNYYQNYETQQLDNHRKQLLKRTLKQWVKVKNRQIWKMTLRSYFELKRGK